MKKLSSTLVLQRENFLNEFLSNLALSTKYQIDACIAIAQDDVHVLVQVMLAYLENQNKNHLDQNSRYLLQHMDLNICYWKKPEAHEGLFHYFENMKSVQTEDFKLFVSLYKQKCRLTINYSPTVFNYFGNYAGADKGFDAVFADLSSDHNVDNLYSLYDGLWLKLMNEKCDFDSGIINKIVALKEERGWCKIKADYLNNYYKSTEDNWPPNEFVQLVQNCEQLVAQSDESTGTTIHEYFGTEFLQEIIFKDHAFVFKIPNNSRYYAGKQFVLSINAMKDNNPDSFCVKLLAVDTSREHPCLYDNQDPPKIHLALSIETLTKRSIFPVSWCGKPAHNDDKTYWEWGYIRNQETVPADTLLRKHSQGLFIWNKFKDVSLESTYKIICYLLE